MELKKKKKANPITSDFFGKGIPDKAAAVLLT